LEQRRKDCCNTYSNRVPDANAFGHSDTDANAFGHSDTDANAFGFCDTIFHKILHRTSDQKF
jgi:hypothetical protein